MRKLDPRFELAWTIYRRRRRETRLLLPLWIIGGMAVIGLCVALTLAVRIAHDDRLRDLDSILAMMMLIVLGVFFGTFVGAVTALLASVVLRTKKWTIAVMLLLAPELVWMVGFAAVVSPNASPTVWAIAIAAPLVLMLVAAWKLLPNERFQCRPGRCPVCGYEMLGIDQHGCSECGWER